MVLQDIRCGRNEGFEVKLCRDSMAFKLKSHTGKLGRFGAQGKLVIIEAFARTRTQGVSDWLLSFRSACCLHLVALAAQTGQQSWAGAHYLPPAPHRYVALRLVDCLEAHLPGIQS